MIPRRRFYFLKTYISHDACELNDLPADGFVCYGCSDQQGTPPYIDGKVLAGTRAQKPNTPSERELSLNDKMISSTEDTQQLYVTR